MKNKQTAVNWLVEQLQAPCRGIPSHIIEQAKEIEKQMVIDIVEKSRATGLTAEYLLLTYESKESDDTTLEQIDQNNPVTRGSTALVKKEQKKLITEIMDEDAKNGLYDISHQTELSDEEIGKGRDENIPIDERDMWSERFYFTIGAKWYREQLKKK